MGRVFGAVLLSATILLAGCATAPSPAESTTGAVVEGPHWIEKPSGAVFARFYPERAQRLRRSGHAVIRCVVNAGGRLEQCVVVSEDPVDFAFGQAALHLAPYFLMSTLRDGRSPGGASVTIPITFSIG